MAEERGRRVKSGDVIAEIETDKATMEVEAVDEGMLAKILVPEGTENVAVNTPIAVIAGEGEDAARREARRRPSRNGASAAQPDSTRVPKAAAAQEAKPKRSHAASPRPCAAAPRSRRAGVPEGAEMVTMTVREALRDAMAEEMRRDDAVFVMGEEVAEYQGAYKVTQGLLQEFGARRVVDTPITEHGFAGLGVGAAMAGLSRSSSS